MPNPCEECTAVFTSIKGKKSKGVNSPAPKPGRHQRGLAQWKPGQALGEL